MRVTCQLSLLEFSRDSTEYTQDSTQSRNEIYITGMEELSLKTLRSASVKYVLLRQKDISL